MFFCERVFPKGHPIGFRGSVIIEKQYFIVRIARSNHSQVLKNLLNGSELTRYIFLEFGKIFRTS